LFFEKARDIVGLYLSPPERALVLCVDEKSQIQALDRSQPVLPMRPGQVERRTHDYTRHGTTSLFAALDIASGAVIGRYYPKHRTSEFRKLLDQIETNVPSGLDVHLVMDNYATHKTKTHPGLADKAATMACALHANQSVLDHSSRAVFALITEKPIRRGGHRSTQHLEADIRAFIDAHDADPKPFRWTKSADDFLAAIQHFCTRTMQINRTSETGHLAVGARNHRRSCSQTAAFPARIS